MSLLTGCVCVHLKFHYFAQLFSDFSVFLTVQNVIFHLFRSAVCWSSKMGQTISQIPCLMLLDTDCLSFVFVPIPSPYRGVFHKVFKLELFTLTWSLHPYTKNLSQFVIHPILCVSVCVPLKPTYHRISVSHFTFRSGHPLRTIVKREFGTCVAKRRFFFSVNSTDLEEVF